MSIEPTLPFAEEVDRRSKRVNPRLLVPLRPTYLTGYGAAFCGDSLKLLKALPAGSVNLVMTSPPYALEFRKEYGNETKAKYVEWFRPFADEVRRVLSTNGSFVLNIGGSYESGRPTRSLYQFRLLLMLCDELGFHLAQEFFWYNPAKLPSPAEWVTVRRERVKDSVEYVWWLSPHPHPKADNRRVLVPYSPDMKRLLARGYKTKTRPSGHVITNKFRDRGGAIPSNVIERGNNESNSDYIKKCTATGQKPHPARYPAALPEFFVKLLTDEDDLVLDPFAGSNTTGAVCETLRRRWMSCDLRKDYVKNSRLRFDYFISDPC